MKEKLNQIYRTEFKLNFIKKIFLYSRMNYRSFESAIQLNSRLTTKKTIKFKNLPNKSFDISELKQNDLRTIYNESECSQIEKQKNKHKF